MPDTGTSAPQHFDMIIVGAGLSGIGAAWQFQKKCPGKTYAILEQRDAIGGTWDLFRYPGIRSDSDMHTLGYGFRPWTEAKAIADGPSIRKYVRDTAREGDIERHIRFGHKVAACDWDSSSATWTVTAEKDGLPVRLTCSFLMMCTGYYRYDRGHRPSFPGEEQFGGTFVHPQHWPDDLDWAGKRVVVIGSGATAVTIVPEMAKTADKVTMLQRSPTYVVARPGKDAFANGLRKVLPDKLAYGIVRWRNVLLQKFFYHQAQAKPEQARRRLTTLAAKALGPDYPVDPHFTPKYAPWDQRLCLIPDGDLFEAIKSGRADVETDQIDTITENGIQLKSGRQLHADIIVTATGLDLLFLGGAQMTVDGADYDVSRQMIYRGAMLSGAPNLFFIFGYVNASWTLRADLISDYACRLISYMGDEGHDVALPVFHGDADAGRPWLEFSSGYVQRAVDRFPKQGSEGPWQYHQNYTRDLRDMKLGRLSDGVLQFSSVEEPVEPR